MMRRFCGARKRISPVIVRRKMKEWLVWDTMPCSPALPLRLLVISTTSPIAMWGGCVLCGVGWVIGWVCRRVEISVRRCDISCSWRMSWIWSEVTESWRERMWVLKILLESLAYAKAEKRLL